MTIDDTPEAIFHPQVSSQDSRALPRTRRRQQWARSVAVTAASNCAPVAPTLEAVMYAGEEA